MIWIEFVVSSDCYKADCYEKLLNTVETMGRKVSAVISIYNVEV